MSLGDEVIPPIGPWGYAFFRGLARDYGRLTRGPLGVEGLENVPRSGRAIIGANHIAYIDPLLVGVALEGLRYPHFLGNREVFRIPVLGTFLKSVGTIPLSRGKGDIGAIRHALDILDREGLMAIFPEGTRSKTGRPGRPKSGIGLLARESGAPVIPARISGTTPFFSTRTLRIKFGKPIRYEAGSSRKDDKAFAEKVMDEILKL